jgi:DNA invertase Pin-like site-specific DNA recombinase
VKPEPAIKGLWMPAAIYTRVSTSKQLGRRVESCESQEAICREHILAHAPTKGWQLVQSFTDPAYSGATMKRPGMDALKRAVAAGEIKVVVIFKLERVLRSTDEWAPFRTFLHQNDCELVSAMEDISEKTALGRLKNNLLVSVSEYDRLNIAEKVRAKMGEQAKRGLWNGGSVPYGYAYDKNTQTLTPHPEEAPVVRRIFHDAAKLVSLSDLANILNAEGFRTKQRSMRRRDGTREIVGKQLFRSDGLRLLVTNPMYRGAVRFGGNEFDGQHPPLVAKELWEQANAAVRETRPRPEVRVDENMHQYLLKGICSCGHCGRALVPKTCGLSNNAGKRYRYYNCGSVMRDGRSVACPVGRLSAAALDGVTIAFLSQVSKQPPLVARVLDATRTRTKGDRQVLRAELESLEAKQAKVREELGRCVDAVLKSNLGVLGPELMQRAESLRIEQDQLTVQLERKRQELAACEAASFDAQRVQSSLERLGTLLSKLAPAERIELVRLFVDRVEVREPAKSQFGASVDDGGTRRVLALRIKLHLPRLIEGVERTDQVAGIARRLPVAGLRGVNLEASVDFTHAVRGEVTVLAPFQYAVRVSERGRNSETSTSAHAPGEPKHLVLRAQEWRHMLETGHAANRLVLARRHGVTPGAVTRIMKLIELLPEIQNFLAALKSREAIRHFGMRKVGALAALPTDAQRAAFERIRRAFAQTTPELVEGETLKPLRPAQKGVEEKSDNERIIALLRAAGPTTPREIGAATNLSRITIYRRLNALAATGQIAATGNTRNVRYALAAP